MKVEQPKVVAIITITLIYKMPMKLKKELAKKKKIKKN
jgi:hypothetical protein